MKKIKISKELYHFCYSKRTCFLLLSVCDVNWISGSDIKKSFLATINVSLVEDYSGTLGYGNPVGLADTPNDAIKKCIEELNNDIQLNRISNEELLCCKDIPLIEIKDFQSFDMTKEGSIEIIENGQNSFLKFYMRNDEGHIKYLSSISNKVFYAKNEDEMLESLIEKMKDKKKNYKVSNNLRTKNNLFPSFQDFRR